jgi:hypothetical protein
MACRKTGIKSWEVGVTPLLYRAFKHRSSSVKVQERRCEASAKMMKSRQIKKSQPE